MTTEFGLSVDIGGIGYEQGTPVFMDLADAAPTHPFVFVDTQKTERWFPHNITVLQPEVRSWEGFFRRFLAQYKIPLPDASAHDVRMDFVLDFLRGKQVVALMREIGRILKPGSSFYMVDFSPNCAHARRIAKLCGLDLTARLNQEQLLTCGYPLSPNTESFIELNLDGTIPLTTELNIFENT